MTTSDRIAIAPGILAWARKTAGYDVATAAKKLAVSSERLESWESGAISPTITQLRNMSKLYKRPLAVLLLPEPPTEFSVLKEYRRFANEEAYEWSPALHAEYKRALMQREVVLELADLSPGSVPESSFTFRTNVTQPVEIVAAAIRELLQISNWNGTVRSDAGRALNAVSDAVERLGILVLHTRDVDIHEMRGLSIPEWPYPVILLNGSDWPRPRLFSLLHELTHLALHSGGVCDLHESRSQRATPTDLTEAFCNAVAAAVLMPAKEVQGDAAVKATNAWQLENLQAIAGRFGASSEAFLLRLISLGITTWDVYWQLKPELESAYAAAMAEKKERQRATKSGPSYYTVKARNLGHGYVHSVLDAFAARAISSFDVADYLDLKFNQLGQIQGVIR